MIMIFCISVCCAEVDAPTTPEETPQVDTMTLNEITPESALNFVSIAVAQYEGTWEEHIVLRQSLRVIAGALGLYEQTEK